MFNALMRFKRAGKEIIVYSPNDISGSSYHLISMADEIYTHRMSSINLKGITIGRIY